LVSGNKKQRNPATAAVAPYKQIASRGEIEYTTCDMNAVRIDPILETVPHVPMPSALIDVG